MILDALMNKDEYIQALLGGFRGGFAAKLADAWCHADYGNRKTLEEAFPKIFYWAQR